VPFPIIEKFLFQELQLVRDAVPRQAESLVEHI